MVLLKERASQEVFETWFKELSIGNINDNQATLTVPNRFFRDWIRDHYQNLLEEALGTAMGQTAVRVSYVLPEAESREKLTSAPEPDRPVQAAALKGKRTAHLDGRYTFATFVAASNNQLARAASLKVAESPGISYNPLLIYGGVGLGKTHLMHAIGNLVMGRADLRIAYVTSEQFTNEVCAGAIGTSTCFWSTISNSLPASRRLRKSFFTPSIAYTKPASKSSCQAIVIPRTLPTWKSGCAPGWTGGWSPIFNRIRWRRASPSYGTNRSGKGSSCPMRCRCLWRPMSNPIFASSKDR